MLTLNCEEPMSYSRKRRAASLTAETLWNMQMKKQRLEEKFEEMQRMESVPKLRIKRERRLRSRSGKTNENSDRYLANHEIEHDQNFSITSLIKYEHTWKASIISISEYQQSLPQEPIQPCAKADKTSSSTVCSDGCNTLANHILRQSANNYKNSWFDQVNELSDNDLDGPQNMMCHNDVFCEENCRSCQRKTCQYNSTSKCHSANIQSFESDDFSENLGVLNQLTKYDAEY